MAEDQHLGQAVKVHRPRQVRIQQQRRQFRGEAQAPADVAPVQRFDADAVANKVHGALARVVDARGEHPVELPQAVKARFLEKVRNNFDVTTAVESVTALLQPGTQFDVVEDLAVPDARDLSDANRLPTAGDVDDGQQSTMRRS